MLTMIMDEDNKGTRLSSTRYVSDRSFQFDVVKLMS